MKERQIILRLVAEGKITPEEADTLLAALEDESDTDDRVDEGGATDADAPGPGAESGSRQGRRKTYTYTSTTPGGRRGTTTASTIDLGDLERTMAELGRTLPEVTATALKGVAKGLGRVRKAAAHVKYGIHLDRHRVSGTRELTMPARSGDFLIVEVPLGDVTVNYADVNELQVQATLSVWGSSPEDAQKRLDATKVRIDRQDTEIVVGHAEPDIKGIGVVVTRDTSIDYELTVPHGVHLRVSTKAGDIAVKGSPRGRWELDTRLGDVRLVVGDDPDMALQAETSLGGVRVELGGTVTNDVRRFASTYGSGQAAVHARTRLGDISISHQ